MKKSKIVLIFILIMIIILVGGYFGIKYVKEKQEKTTPVEEYTPQEEINDEQLRQTIISLYFINKDTKEIMPEARLVDVNVLIQNPYQTLVELLIGGSKNDKLETIIPKETKVQSAKLTGDCVELNLSNEFLEASEKKETKEKMIQSIVNTLTELTEVNAVKIIIQGEEVPEFSEIYVRK